MKLAAVRTLTYSLLALTCLLLVGFWYTDIFPLTWIALGLVIVIGVINHILWRCPHCGKNLGRMEKQSFCGNCGKELEM